MLNESDVLRARLMEAERERKALADFFWVVRGHHRAGELTVTNRQVLKLVDDPVLFAAAQEKPT